MPSIPFARPHHAAAMAVNRLGCGSRLTHKDRLAASLRAHGASDVAPLTFTLPAEREAFVAFCRQERRARREEEEREDREEERVEREEERGEDEEDGNGDGQRQGDETTDTAVTADITNITNTAAATLLPLSPPLSSLLSPPPAKHPHGRRRRRRPTRWRPTAWIVKPWNTGRGRGIFMTRDAAYIVKRVADTDERCVVCRYVELSVLCVCVCCVCVCVCVCGCVGGCVVFSST